MPSASRIFGSWFTVAGKRVKVWRAHEADARGDTGEIDGDGVLVTRHGALALDEVQPEGKRPMAGAAWRMGVHGSARVDS